ncbi:hypothetical protein HRG_013120 [Hirsutella rhossiliensis]
MDRKVHRCLKVTVVQQSGWRLRPGKYFPAINSGRPSLRRPRKGRVKLRSKLEDPANRKVKSARSTTRATLDEAAANSTTEPRKLQIIQELNRQVKETGDELKHMRDKLNVIASSRSSRATRPVHECHTQIQATNVRTLSASTETLYCTFDTQSYTHDDTLCGPNYHPCRRGLIFLSQTSAPSTTRRLTDRRPDKSLESGCSSTFRHQLLHIVWGHHDVTLTWFGYLTACRYSPGIIRLYRDQLLYQRNALELVREQVLIAKVAMNHLGSSITCTLHGPLLTSNAISLHSTLVRLRPDKSHVPSTPSFSWLGYVSSESALGRSGVPSSSVPQDFTPGDNFLQKQLDVMALASTIQLHALLPDSPPTSWSATFNVASDDTHFPCDSHARWIHLASSRHCRFALRTADPYTLDNPDRQLASVRGGRTRGCVLHHLRRNYIRVIGLPPGASGPHRLNGPRMAMQLWPLCLGYHDPHLASLWATWAGLTEEHLLFRCKKWMAEREIMLQCARTKIGNLSYFSAIKFPIATGRLDREQGQQSSIKKFHTATDHASAAEDRMPNTWRKLGSIRTVPRNHRGHASKGMSPYQQVSGNMNAWPWPGLNAFLRLQILRQLLVEASGAEKPYSDMANDIAHIIGFSSHSGFLVYMASNGDKVFTISIKLPAIRRWHHILCGHLNDVDQKRCSHDEPCQLGVQPFQIITETCKRCMQDKTFRSKFHDLRDKASLFRYWECRKLMNIPVFKSITAEMETRRDQENRQTSDLRCERGFYGSDKGRALLERAMEMILMETNKPEASPPFTTNGPNEAAIRDDQVRARFLALRASANLILRNQPRCCLTNPNVEWSNDAFCSELMVSSRPRKLPSAQVHGDRTLLFKADLDACKPRCMNQVVCNAGPLPVLDDQSQATRSFAARNALLPSVLAYPFFTAWKGVTMLCVDIIELIQVVDPLIDAYFSPAANRARIIIFGLALVFRLPFIGATVWQFGRSGVEYWWAAPMVSHLTTVVMVITIWRKTQYFRRFGRRSNRPQPEQPTSNQGMPWLGAVSGLVFLASSVLLVYTSLEVSVDFACLIKEHQRKRVDREMEMEMSVVIKSGTEQVLSQTDGNLHHFDANAPSNHFMVRSATYKLIHADFHQSLRYVPKDFPGLPEGINAVGSVQTSRYVLLTSTNEASIGFQTVGGTSSPQTTTVLMAVTAASRVCIGGCSGSVQESNSQPQTKVSARRLDSSFSMLNLSNSVATNNSPQYAHDRVAGGAHIRCCLNRRDTSHDSVTRGQFPDKSRMKASVM